MFKGAFASVAHTKGRKQYKAIGKAIGVERIEDMKPKCGAKWAYYLKPVIAELTSAFGEDPESWPEGDIRAVVGRSKLGYRLNTTYWPAS